MPRCFLCVDRRRAPHHKSVPSKFQMWRENTTPSVQRNAEAAKWNEWNGIKRDWVRISIIYIERIDCPNNNHGSCLIWLSFCPRFFPFCLKFAWISCKCLVTLVITSSALATFFNLTWPDSIVSSAANNIKSAKSCIQHAQQHEDIQQHKSCSFETSDTASIAIESVTWLHPSHRWTLTYFVVILWYGSVQLHHRIRKYL